MDAKQSLSPKAVQMDSMYRFIPQSKKRELLRLIIQDQFTIKQAAKKLGLNYSTAKYTVKQSKRVGKIKKVSCFRYGDIQFPQSQSNFRCQGLPNNFNLNQALQYDNNTVRGSRSTLLQSNIASLIQPNIGTFHNTNRSSSLSQNLAGIQNHQNPLLQFMKDDDSLNKSQKHLILQQVNKQIHSTQEAIQRTFLLGYFLKSQQNPMILSLFQELQKQLISVAQNQMAMFTILGRNIFDSDIQSHQNKGLFVQFQSQHPNLKNFDKNVMCYNNSSRENNYISQQRVVDPNLKNNKTTQFSINKPITPPKAAATMTQIKETDYTKQEVNNLCNFVKSPVPSSSSQ